jgi:hypothetical protein
MAIADARSRCHRFNEGTRPEARSHDSGSTSS